MDKQQAIELIDRALAQLQADRQTHLALQQAISVLKDGQRQDSETPAGNGKATKAA